MPWIHNHLVLPLCDPDRHRGLPHRLRAIERFESKPPARQLAIQEKRVRAMLRHAGETSLYYRQLFGKAGFRATSWRLGDPIPLPRMTRDILRAQGRDICSMLFDEDQLSAAATGGTTSTPVSIWRDLEGLRDKTALQYHLNRKSGFDQGTPVLLIWGADWDFATQPSWRWRLYEQTLLQRSVSPAGALTPEFYSRTLRLLNRRKPVVLYGYAGATARFAEWLRSTGARYHKPRRLIVTAEPLTPGDRALLQDVFGCPVVEHYGSREVGMVAAQCFAGRFHFHPWACYIELEFAGNTPAGPMYQLIVTDLLNRGMPLIRYETGDCVLASDRPCLCGSSYPSVTAILGRSCDNILCADGTQFPGVALSVLWPSDNSGFRALRQMQLVQKNITRMHLRYSAEGHPWVIRNEIARVCAEIEAQLGNRLEWSYEAVPEIRRERSGKLRLTICEVPAEEYPAALRMTG